MFEDRLKDLMERNSTVKGILQGDVHLYWKLDSRVQHLIDIELGLRKTVEFYTVRDSSEAAELISKTILGMTETAALNICRTEKHKGLKDFDFRVVERDDKSYAITCDMVPTRLNIRIKKDVVVEAYTG